ncbi:phosphodiester glycosidase family protein [Synechococcus moorigangaii CMS01]|nr:phosphodiester glycosidase family protein [Synechococcus moorigangaii CMS01]
MGLCRWQWFLGTIGCLGLGLGVPHGGWGGMTSGQAIANPIGLNTQIQTKGGQIRLNGQTLRGAWAQWSENGTMRLGIESTTLEKTLGMELRNGTDLGQQAVTWFNNTPYQFPIRFAAPYRYLDVTTLATAQQWQVRANGNILELTTPKAQVLAVRQAQQPWGMRFVVDLDRPVLWQKVNPTTLRLQSDYGSVAQRLSGQLTGSNKLPLTLKNSNGLTELVFGGGTTDIQVSTLGGPNRLVIDLRRQPEAQDRSVQWLPGVRWRQENFSANSGPVRVTWLEIEPTQRQLQLKPITAAANTIVGLEPLLIQADNSQAIAAINAGFFNRNNQYPLGIVQANGALLSGPILTRGAVAWDNTGRWEFDRLQIQEDLVASNSERLSLDLINSGYVKAGAARYDRAWGSRYTTIADNEIVLTVTATGGREQVVRQETAGKAGQNSYEIPQGGYLLVFRSFRTGASKFPVGTTLTRTQRFTPNSFANLPNIIGGGPLLLKNGQVVLNGQAEQFSTAFNIQSASRSAIAKTHDNKILLVTLHGAAEETAGATLNEWANILRRLGATDALNLDGGGSSALAIGANLGDRHPTTAGRVNNGIGLFLQ